jgi:hypothetical protein
MKTMAHFTQTALILVLTLTVAFVCFSVQAAAKSYVIDGNSVVVAADVDNNGKIDVCDLVKTANSKTLLPASDLNGNGSIDSYDLAIIRAMIIGIDNSLWTE